VPEIGGRREPRWYAIGMHRSVPHPLDIGREVAFGLLGALAYFGVRGITEGNVAVAHENAKEVVAFEKAFGMYWELQLQELVIDSGWIVTFMNWVYIYGHWPVIGAVAAWLLLRDPDAYRLYRNAFLISGAIGLVVFATYPLAPPRLADLEIIDTVSEQSRSFQYLQPPTFVNQYAAMPSLHVGWNILIGIALVKSAASYLPLKVFGWVMPTLMAISVVLTANHYLIDGVVGALVALFGLWLAHRFVDWRKDPPRWWPAPGSGRERTGASSAGRATVRRRGL